MSTVPLVSRAKRRSKEELSHDEKTIKLDILRYNPEADNEPTSAFGSHNEAWSLLDALEYIKDELDSSLTYRWSCRMAVCGNCGMVVNGRPQLGCETSCVITTRTPSRLSRWPTSRSRKI